MNSIYLVIIILIIITLILCFYKKTERFSVNTDSITGLNKSIGEIYTYPDCTGCITTNNKLKPNFAYNITDNRCVKNSSTGYVDKTVLDGIISYANAPTSAGISSCYNNYNSMYSYVTGKYVMIFRNDSIRMRFNHISVHERDTTVSSISSGSTIFTTNLAVNASNQYVYPDSVLDSTDSNVLTFVSGTPFSYTVIKLPNIKNIGYVNIKHIDTTDAATLNGAILVVLNDPVSNVDDVHANVVFYTTINNNDLNRTIYTYNNLIKPLPEYLSESMMIINRWILPCSNCGSSAGKLFTGHHYKSGTHKCYKPLANDINLTVLSSDIPTDTLTTKFGSCSNDFDTRYEPPSGKFIQIKRSDNRDIGIKISRIQLYSDYEYNVNDITNIYALVKTYSDNTVLFKNVLDNSEDTILSTTNDKNSFIHIDTGNINNIVISGISIKIPISERYNIVGIKFIIISIDESNVFDVSKMTVTCERTITDADVSMTKTQLGDVNSYTYLIPFTHNKNESLSTRTDIIINNEVTYNSADKYLTTYKRGTLYYQVPYTIYTMNGRKIIANTLTDATATLDKINVSDAVTLFNFSSNADMSSVPGTTNSQLLNPISCRYIQLVSNGTNVLSGVVTLIELYDSNKTVIKSVSNPTVIYESPHNDYTKYLTDISTGALDKGSILIDLGNDTTITFIKINVSSTTLDNMKNVILNMIKNNSNKVYTFTFTNPTTTNYLVTDNNEINLTGSFIVNKYAYPSCLTLNTCNVIAPNTYYILEDTRCFKSKGINDLTTCTSENCMNNLSDYTKTNKIEYVDANFTSCIDGDETRILNPLVLHFDTSDLTTLFKDRAGTDPATSINDNIYRWNTTSSSKISTYGYVKDYYNYSPKLSQFTEGTIGLDFGTSTNQISLFFEPKLSGVSNITCFYVFKITQNGDIGHILNSNRSYLRSGSQVIECMYTSDTAYNYSFRSFIPIIYVITGNSRTLKTNCYIYNNGLVAISPDLTYSTMFKTWSVATIGRAWLYGDNTNYFIVSEIKIYNYVMSESTILTECAALKTKWNIPDPSNIVVHFDASDLSSVFDSSGIDMFASQTDIVKTWRTKSTSLIDTTASTNQSPQLERANGRYLINFKPVTGSVFTYTANLNNYYNATCILVFKMNGQEATGHPINLGGSWLINGSSVYESFYTNSLSEWGGRTPYSYFIPLRSIIIYIVTANNTVKKTKCYIYDSDTLTQVSPDLPYGDNFRTNNSKMMGVLSWGDPGANEFSLAEIQIYGSMLSNEDITKECILLNNKWRPKYLAIHFSASDINTTFQDPEGTVQATQTGHVVRCWKTTSDSVWQITALVPNGSRPAKSIFSSSNPCIDFDANGGSGLFKFTQSFDMISSTLIIVFKAAMNNPLGHPFTPYWGIFNWAGANQVKEYFYTSALISEPFGMYPFLIDMAQPYMIYSVVADSAYGITRCYRYTTSLVQISNNIVYDNRINTQIFEHHIGTANLPSINHFKLAEILVYNYAKTTEELTTECAALKTKWLIP